MRTSEEWKRYYEENARRLLEIPWELGAELTAEEKRAIAGSLREFQAGESSEGKHLYNYARDYAARSGDTVYLEALRLFIMEEGRHSRDLKRYLILNGITPVTTTFTDQVFRKLRHLFGGLEISIAVLITAEIISEVFYALLREATASSILRRLCDQILRDEVEHVRFQSDQLSKLRAARGRLGMGVTMAMQRFLFRVTVLVVWIVHRRTIAAGGGSLGIWWNRCRERFNLAFSQQRVAIPLEEPVEIQGY